MAAGGQEDAEGGLFSGINVTPLVDITLVLLIIFMVAAPLMVTNPAIKVALPKAATGEESQKTTLALTMQRDQGGAVRLFANGEKTDETRVRGMAAALASRTPDPQATIAADKGIAYGEVMHIVDVVRSQGVSRFALDTEAIPQ
jgi:biopolymer transport protein ExbD